MKNKLDAFFSVSQRGSSFKSEILGGVTTFMAMAYILAVHPALMKAAGMPVGAVVVAVAVSSGIATLCMGLYAKYPFALAPGMGTNIFFAYTLVAGGIFTWQQSLSVVFIAGLLFVLLTSIGAREAVANALPAPIKLGIGASVGVFLVYLGMKSAGLINFGPTGISRGNFASPATLLAIIGLFITITLQVKNVLGGLLIGILVTTLIGIPMGVTQMPAALFSLPPSLAPISFQLDFQGLLRLETLPFIFVFFIGDFFSTLGTLLGVSSKAGFLDKNGNLPQIEKPFLVDALATVGGSLMGVTTITTYVESASGVMAGARTGLSSVVTAFLFFVSVFLTPLFLMIPAAATAPCLIIIGFMLLDGLRSIKFGVLDDTIAPLSMLTVTAYTASMSNGIAAGVLLYTFIKLIKGKFRNIHPIMYAMCLIFIYYLAS